MTIREVLRCAQPLLFEDGFEGYEYSYGGTFFYARFRNRFYAITAKHCLNNRDLKTIRLVRPDQTKQRAFLSHEIVTVIEEPDGIVCDWADLAIITLNAAKLSETDKMASWFLDLDRLLNYPPTLASKDGLGLKGCPKHAGGIDYESGIIKLGFVAWSGKYIGPSHERNLHKLKFDDLKGVPSLDGFSGSPVFKLVQNAFEKSHWFAGVLLRGTTSSGIAHFVDYKIVYEALNIISHRP